MANRVRDLPESIADAQRIFELSNRNSGSDEFSALWDEENAY